jgi:hypothetical protein
MRNGEEVAMKGVEVEVEICGSKPPVAVSTRTILISFVIEPVYSPIVPHIRYFGP